MHDSATPADRNVERLLQVSYQPHQPDPAFVERVRAELAKVRPAAIRPPAPFSARQLLAAGSLAAGVAIAALWFAWPSAPRRPEPQLALAPRTTGLRPRPAPTPPKVEELALQGSVRTGPLERKRVRCPDGSVLLFNTDSRATLVADRTLRLDAGEVYVEVSPRPAGSRGATFTVQAPGRKFLALGTKFAIRAGAAASSLLVTQGSVRADDPALTVAAGQSLPAGASQPVAAPAAAAQLDWTRELMVASESPLVPANQHAGGALVALDPNGQEAKLELRSYRVDVYVEDGFARTTIDQTYFNHTPGRLEGTFYFPLPADASLSRLAMYVDGVRMEGGMAERDHARNVFETIVYQRRDPALLEWVDGNTFKMRVFPLEGRQEKRILLSYTQRLPAFEERLSYRFPAGHSLGEVRDWSAQLRIVRGAPYAWACGSHALDASFDGADLVLRASGQHVRLDRDLYVELHQKPANERTRWSKMEHDGWQYLMLRHRPELPVAQRRERRDWVVLFESSADRNPLIARAQMEVFRGVMEQAEHGDTFRILTADTRLHALHEQPLDATPANIAQAMTWLEGTHLIGALNLEQALTAVQPLLASSANPWLVHLGSGIPIVGEQNTDQLLAMIPDNARYVGVGVGQRVNRGFMKAAAERSSGYSTQINPDEPIAWRSFQLASALNAPRLQRLQAADATGAHWHLYDGMLLHGEELCTMTRVPVGQPLPQDVTITGIVNGRNLSWKLPVEGVADGAGYLPRTWARLEIDELLVKDAVKNKGAIVALSKAMYVMSPYTSLLVLENDAMYEQYKVDRGRKDHWAMYPAPAKIDVVAEPLPKLFGPAEPDANAVLQERIIRTPSSPLSKSGNESKQFYGKTFYLFSALGDVPAAGNGQWGDAYFTNPNNAYGGSAGDLDGAIISDLSGSMQLEEARKSLRDTERSLDRSKSLSRNGVSKLSLGDKRAIDQLAQRDGSTRNFRLKNTSTEVKQLQRRSGDAQRQLLFFDSKAKGELRSSHPSPDGDEEKILITGGFRRAGAVNDFTPNGFVAGLPEPTLLQELEFGVNALPSIELLKKSVELNGGTLNGRSRLGLVPAKAKRAAITGEASPVPPADPEPLYDLSGSDLLYSRPQYQQRGSTFSDLLAYAPAFNTTRADLLAALECESTCDVRQPHGQVDPAARTLVQAARQLGWESVSLLDARGNPLQQLTIDGRGRFTSRGFGSEGLVEEIACDGDTLWHAYRELGLVAERKVSRFHRELWLAACPWILPPVEDLQQGYHVRAAGDNQLTLVPVLGDGPQLTIVLDAQRRVVERRLLAADGKLLGRLVIEAGQTLRVLDAQGKELSRRSVLRQPAAEPNVKPNFSALLVVPMPFLNETAVRLRLGERRSTAVDQLTQAELLPLFVAHCAAGNAKEALQLYRNQIDGRGPRKVGHFVLLAAAGANLDGDNGNAVGHLPGVPLAEYLTMSTSPLLQKHALGLIKLEADGLLGRLLQFRSLMHRWDSGVSARSTPDERRAEWRKLLAFAKHDPQSQLGWSLLERMARNYPPADGDPLWLELAEAYRSFEHAPGLAYAARYEAALCMHHHQAGSAVEPLTQLYRDAFAQGLLPSLSDDFLRAMRTAQKDHFSELLRSTAEQLIKVGLRTEVVVLAEQAARLGDELLADQLHGLALANIHDDKECRTVTLNVVQVLAARQQFPRADDRLQPLLADSAFAKEPMLWRIGAALAEKRNQKTRAIACLEKAIDLEFANLPEVVNLQTIRQEYGQLLTHYQEVATSLATLHLDPPADFIPQVIRIADRWRSLETEPQDVCTRTAAILRTLGAKEFAWDYLTSPLSHRPNEAAPWLSLATTLRDQGELDLADQAYAAAFNAEATNAQILWDRIQLLRQRQKLAEAKPLLERLATGPWQPRFDWLKQQAQQQLKP